MVYIKKNKKKRLFKTAVFVLVLVFAFAAALRAVNEKADGYITELARTGLKRAITEIVNDAVLESMAEGAYGELAKTSCDEGGRVRFISVDSAAVNLFRADVTRRICERMASLEKFYVDVDLSNIFNDEVIFGGTPLSVTVDIVFAGGVETDVKSEFVSAGINQTNYRLSLLVSASVTADVISSFTVDTYTSVNIVDMLIVGDVPTVMWN
jgi:sporulation protein YunB